jgi:hypothetical protein
MRLESKKDKRDSGLPRSAFVTTGGRQRRRGDDEEHVLPPLHPLFLSLPFVSFLFYNRRYLPQSTARFPWYCQRSVVTSAIMSLRRTWVLHSRRTSALHSSLFLCPFLSLTRAAASSSIPTAMEYASALNDACVFTDLLLLLANMAPRRWPRTFVEPRWQGPRELRWSTLPRAPLSLPRRPLCDAAPPLSSPPRLALGGGCHRGYQLLNVRLQDARWYIPTESSVVDDGSRGEHCRLHSGWGKTPFALLSP